MTSSGTSRMEPSGPPRREPVNSQPASSLPWTTWRNWSGLSTNRLRMAACGLRIGREVARLVERDEEHLTAQAIPRDDKFPEAEPVQIRMRAVEQLDGRAAGENVL